jgi:hypothetical protein
MNKEMAKRIWATVPDAVEKYLQDWADKDGRSISNLCAYLLEEAVKRDQQQLNKVENTEGR